MDNEMSKFGGNQDRGTFDINDLSQKQPPPYSHPSPYPNTQMQHSSETYIPSSQPASQNYTAMAPEPLKSPNTMDQPPSGTDYPLSAPGQIYDPMSQPPFNMCYIPPDPTTQVGQNAALSANRNVIVSSTPVNGTVKRHRYMKIGSVILSAIALAGCLIFLFKRFL